MALNQRVNQGKEKQLFLGSVGVLEGWAALWSTDQNQNLQTGSVLHEVASGTETNIFIQPLALL